MSRAVTCNLAEALYLFAQGARPEEIHLARFWPDGFRELFVIFEGEGAARLHEGFVSGDPAIPVERWSELLAALSKLSISMSGLSL